MPLSHDVFAAVLVPRTADGGLVAAEFRGLIEFLCAQGIRRVVVNGATGECPLTKPAELKEMLTIASEVVGREGTVLCGIGSPGLAGAIELGRIAIEAGAKALLLPMPYFFRYSQDDLGAFCRQAAAALPCPILLYNLPVFSNPLQPPTVCDLIATVTNIVGIKDSSGSLDILRGLTGTPAVRIVGDDNALVAALDEGVCDFVVSGVSCVLPELIRFLFYRREAAQYRAAADLLKEFIGKISVFPTPWGLKLAAQCRGVGPARFQQPLAESRMAQICEFQTWFQDWWPKASVLLAQA